MKIQILGSGCDRCDRMYKHAVEALERIGDAAADSGIEKVVDPEVFYKHKVAITPALVIDDDVIAVGKVLTTDEIEAELLKHGGGG